MSGFEKSLKLILEESGLEVIEYKRPKEVDYKSVKGLTKSHNPPEYTPLKLKHTTILQCLYVDNGVFQLRSRE